MVSSRKQTLQRQWFLSLFMKDSSLRLMYRKVILSSSLPYNSCVAIYVLLEIL